MNAEEFRAMLDIHAQPEDGKYPTLDDYAEALREIDVRERRVAEATRRRDFTPYSRGGQPFGNDLLRAMGLGMGGIQPNNSSDEAWNAYQHRRSLE